MDNITTWQLRADPENIPIAGLAVLDLLKDELTVTVDWETITDDFCYLTYPNGEVFDCFTESDLLRALARAVPSCTLFGVSAVERAQVNHWLCIANTLKSIKKLKETLQYLDNSIAPITFLVAHHLTIADLALFHRIYRLCHVDMMECSDRIYLLDKPPAHLRRWYNLIFAQTCVQNVLALLANNDIKPRIVKTRLEMLTPLAMMRSTATGDRKQEGKFEILPGAEMGKVVVRFPPEASGYLHIGHAKAALLNQYYAQTFKGTLIMRFDDTNPAKENAEFEKEILADLELLEIKPDIFSHTSSHFQLMLDYCEQLIKDGKAYVDDTSAEQMKSEREQKIESKHRNNDVDKNLSMWHEMCDGTPFGQTCCVRAKIDMNSVNGCMRDPTIYRCKNEPHPRTGTEYKVYPTYDFACPIVDSIENVTHTLRTMEYHDRDEQYYWFIDALKLRKPYIWEFSRLNMTNTVLSKRKLTWFVESNLVDGWDDPRFPTVRGIIRRGMTVQGLKEFIIAQGSSKAVVFMNWDKIWAFNKKVIDRTAPRYTALEYENRVIVHVSDVIPEQIEVPVHPKDESLGTKTVTIGPMVYIDYVDAEILKEHENATFINWGNLRIDKIQRNEKDGRIEKVFATPNLENKDYKKTVKLTWLAVEESEDDYPPTFCVYFDHIISKAVLSKDEDFKKFVSHKTREEVRMLGDPELKKCRKGDIIQLQRRGFFRVDVPYTPKSCWAGVVGPIILFSIPDGSAKDAGLPGAQKAKTNTTTNSTVNKEEANNSKAAKRSKANTTTTAATSEPATTSSSKEDEMLMAISRQGDKVRQLKANKAEKSIIDTEVKELINLKAEYKAVTGKEWKPTMVAPPSNSKIIAVKQEKKPDPPLSEYIQTILDKITAQGNKVRQLKANKAEKSAIDGEIQLLLALKADYKSLTGIDWKPGAKVVTIDLTEETKENEPSIAQTTLSLNELDDRIRQQGDKIRKLKSEGASKASLAPEIDLLLIMKSQYKSLNNDKEWTPDRPTSLSEKELLTKEINEQGDKVRKAKADKVPKDSLDIEIGKLLALKAKYKEVTGTDYPSNHTNRHGSSSGSSNKKASGEKKEQSKGKKEQQSSPVEKQLPVSGGGALKKQTRLGLEAKKEENLPDWYSQVITKGELIEYYDVSGCYILRPWAFAIWKTIRAWFDERITKMGVKECYFPIFVSRAALEKEKTHIEDFAPEVAWVTKSGDSELAEPIAIRPTSETVMYPTFAKWIQSYRDLPIRVNQWNNVVRWEFKHPQPFLRTREFLWQEGHTAFAQKEEAEKEVLDILDLYAQVYTNLLAIPVVRGRKTEKEKFAGGDYTMTVEAFISASGRAIQGATSHHLGQNFSKMFEIIYEHPETQQKEYVYQNSWGMTTRTIGVMIMVHADNQGIILPPHVASIQAIIVPCGITVQTTEEERKALLDACRSLEHQLSNTGGIRCEGDYRDNYSPGWKFNHWELKGVPVRIELGPKDIKAEQIVAVRRDTGEKLILAMDSVETKLKQLLETIHDSMLAKAKMDLANHTKLTKNWMEFCQLLDQKNLLLAPFCGRIVCEEKIKSDSARADDAEPSAPAMGAKSLCIPFEQPAEIIPTVDKCIHPGCTSKPIYYTLFGRSY